jgi:GNAT superfamily N-acetyltransferase
MHFPLIGLDKYFLLSGETIVCNSVAETTAEIIVLSEKTSIAEKDIGIEQKEVGRRFQAGDLCFLALEGDRFLGMVWGHMGDIYIKGAGKKLAVGSQGVYLYGIFTVPEARRRNIFNSLKKRFFQHYQKEGANRFLALVYPGNDIMLRALGKIGFTTHSILTYARFHKIGFLHEWSFDHKKRYLNLVLREPKDCFVL